MQRSRCDEFAHPVATRRGIRSVALEASGHRVHTVVEQSVLRAPVTVRVLVGGAEPGERVHVFAEGVGQARCEERTDKTVGRVGRVGGRH